MISLSTYNKKQIVIKITDLGLMVYDDIAKQRIDMFANDEDGRQKALNIISELMED